MPSMRDLSNSMSTSGSVCSSPIADLRLKLIALPVAIIVLLGMQSHRWLLRPGRSLDHRDLGAQPAAYVAA